MLNGPFLIKKSHCLSGYIPAESPKLHNANVNLRLNITLHYLEAGANIFINMINNKSKYFFLSQVHVNFRKPSTVIDRYVITIFKFVKCHLTNSISSRI